MKMKKLYLSLAASLLFSAGAHATVHCDDPQLWYQGWTGGVQQVPMSLHCSIVNDTNTTRNYHIQIHGFVIDNQTGGTVGNGVNQYNVQLAPGQAVTDNYNTNFQVRYNHMGYFRSGLEFTLTDGDNTHSTWYGVVSVPR